MTTVRLVLGRIRQRLARAARAARAGGLRAAGAWGYDAAVVVGAGFVAQGLGMVHPALPWLWIGAGILFVVSRAQPKAR